MLKIKYSSEDIVTPECCYIKKFDIDLSCRNANTISISFYNNNLYCIFNGIHNIEHINHSSENDFLEFRLWTDSKILAMWIYNSSTVINTMKIIQEKLFNGEYIIEVQEKYGKYKIVDDCDKIPINLSEYDLVFLYKKDDDLEIIRCSFEEFYNICSNNIVENFYERQYHILTPNDKQRFKIKYNKNHINYIKENTKKWKDKIGNMDIAQYHMLIYGE